MNLKVRIKNVYFWIGLVGVILTAMGISPEMLTSWQAVYDAFISLISNPFMLGSVFIAVVGVLVDPTTSGISDSALAKTYNRPRKDGEQPQ